VTLSGANRHDSIILAATLDAIPGVRREGPGRPRRRPERLHADKGCDHRRCRTACCACGIKPRIARRGIESSQRLGRHRWVAERTHGWMARLRRLTIRYGRHEEIHLAFVILGCVLVCLNQIRQFC
jgi:transposase